LSPGDVQPAYRGAVGLEGEMRRAEQRDDRLAREVRRNELEHEVERGGVRLRRQRQRVKRLVGNAGICEHVTRQIDIRQLPLEHNGPACEIVRTGSLHCGGD
jgi:hypothetical protein